MACDEELKRKETKLTTMFYIQISNGLLKDGHRKRMGEAVWEFMWCLDRITLIDEDGIGWVLGGKPIQLKDIGADLEVHFTTVSRNLNKLKVDGYINLIYTPRGIKISVYKAKKTFRKNRGNSVDKLNISGGNGGEWFSKDAKRFSTNAKPNIRQMAVDIINNNNNKLEKLKKLKKEKLKIKTI